MLVRSVVIEDQMDVRPAVDRLLDPIQKSQKLLMPMPRLAFADDRSFQNVQRGEEGGCPVPFVIVRLPLRQPGRNGRIGCVRSSA